MSRSLNRSIEVECDEIGVPAFILAGRASLPVRSIIDGWREWFGAIFGEPERDVWIVETGRGVYELHCVRFPTDADLGKAQIGQAQEQWIIERVED